MILLMIVTNDYKSSRDSHSGLLIPKYLYILQPVGSLNEMKIYIFLNVLSRIVSMLT